MSKDKIKIAFFGSSRFSKYILDHLKQNDLLPTIIVTTPDKPVGRKQEITKNIVKVWAEENNVTVFDPAKLKGQFEEDFSKILQENNISVSIVASYGKIMPLRIIEEPPKKTLNIHTSLLPKYRGAAPMQSAILADDKTTGVSIMKIDEQLDHGPIVAMKEIKVKEWPTYEEFEKQTADVGADLLISILPNWIESKIQTVEQDHSKATYTKKVNKEDAQINLSDDPYLNFRKIQAFHEWPQAYFMQTHRGKNIRVKIIEARYENGKLIIEKVLPESGKVMSYKDFLSGYSLITSKSEARE